MNAGILVVTKRRLLVLALAALLTLTALVGPMAVDQLAGTSLTPSALACHGSAGGC